jgi:hypothetical protein
MQASWRTARCAKWKKVRHKGLESALCCRISNLHYALDLWVQQWRKQHARGEVYIVRYADDIVVGFQYEQDARAMRTAMAERLAKFGLELQPKRRGIGRSSR